MWWALRYLDVDEWIYSVCDKSNDEGATTKVRLNGRKSNAFSVKVGVHHGSVLSPLLFIIVLEALSKKFMRGLPMELLNADDLVLIMHPCGVCRKGVASNSILCVGCLKWVHERCSGFSGKLKSDGDFHCRRCLGESMASFRQFRRKRLLLSPM